MEMLDQAQFILANDPSAQIAAALASTVLLLFFWYETGRPRWLGFLLRMLWCPFRMLFWVIWISCICVLPPRGNIIAFAWFISGFLEDSSIQQLRALYPGSLWLPVFLCLVSLITVSYLFIDIVDGLSSWEPRSKKEPPSNTYALWQ